MYLCLKNMHHKDTSKDFKSQKNTIFNVLTFWKQEEYVALIEDFWIASKLTILLRKKQHVWLGGGASACLSAKAVTILFLENK